MSSGEPASVDTPAVTAESDRREMAVLEHIACYKLTTTDALRRLPVFRTAGKNAVANTIRRLKSRGLLTTRPNLYPGLTHAYYQLTPEATKLLGEQDRLAEALSWEQKFQAYAVLCFCIFRDPIQHKISSSEFRALWPDFYRRGEPMHYYIDTVGGLERIGYIKVDRGGRRRRDRIIDDCRRIVDARWSNRRFASEMMSGNFVITIVTPTPEKGRLLEQGLSQWDSTLAEVRVHVEERLMDMLPLSLDRSGKRSGGA